MGNFIRTAVIVAVAILAFSFKHRLEFYLTNFLNNIFLQQNIKNVYTPHELAQYNGVIKDKIYLSIIGSIFDVSEGIKHYGQGSPYNYFVGKDGSRAFITGNFKDESKNKDHVMDLSCDELVVLLNWKNTIMVKYKYVGSLIGRYYNYDGHESEYMKNFRERLDLCKELKEMAKREEHKYPPCNISWSAEEGTRVWCTKSSGGVSRSWAGVPRQLYTPGEEKPRCVCVNIIFENQTGLFKEYENCPNMSHSCYIKN